jgi:ribonuclease HI
MNPGGHGGWGYVIRDSASVLVCEARGHVTPAPEVTNNAVEYVAVGKALLAYRERGRPGPLVVRTSSQLVVMQMRGTWKARRGSYMATLDAVRTLVTQCAFEVRWEWVPLTENMWASEMAYLALEEVGVPRAQVRVRS